MRVWILSDGEPLPLGNEKARLRRMGLLSQILADKNHEVIWMTSNFHHYKKEHYNHTDELVKIRENLTVFLLGTKGYKRNVSISRLNHFKTLEKKIIAFSKELERPDIIISTLAPINISISIVEYSKKNNIPIVIDVRDLWPDIYLEMVPKRFSFFIKPYVYYLKKKVNKLVENSTATIAVTDKFLERVLNSAAINKRKYDRVFNTAYPPKKSIGNEINKEKQVFKFNEKYNLGEKDFVILFLGTIGKQFEFETVITAAKLLSSNNNIKFIIAGEGSNLKELEERTKEQKNIYYPGWIEEEEINYLLTLSKVGLAPYRNSINFTDNIPNKFGEYLSASLPVAIGITGEMKEIVEKNNCGFYYDSPKDLVEKIMSLYEKKERVKEMQMNSKEVYNKKFNSEIVYYEMVTYLEEIYSNYGGGK